LDFRTAHHTVGEFVCRAEEGEQDFGPEGFSSFLESRGIATSSARLDPASVVADSRWGGGPAKSCIEYSIEAVTARWRTLMHEVHCLTAHWMESRRILTRDAAAMRQSAEMV
jgi:argininosuccinate lyase